MKPENERAEVGEIEDEQDVKRLLSLWLEKFGHKVYWEQVNDRGYPTFSVHGIGGESPDLLVISGGETVVLEVKNNHSPASVYDAHTQSIRYWKSLRESEYTAGGETVKPKGVLVATQGSQKGRLFTHPPDRAVGSVSEGRKDAAKRGVIPNVEFCMTEQFTRLLLRHAKIHEGRWASGDFVGALLSSNLDGDVDGRPKIQQFSCDGQKWRNL